jgi:glutamate/tyrosine decarboxylase-like PLP-dependent enzyme
VYEPDWVGPLGEAHRHALDYLTGLPSRPIPPRVGLGELRAMLGGLVPQTSSDPAAVVAELARAADAGVVATSSGRYFGFVVGGTTPAAMAADWLTSAWDQNAGLYAMAAAAAVAEEVAGRWLAELLGLPEEVSVGFVTGAQQANLTGLAAARHEMLRRVGWDVEASGLPAAPPVRVLVGAERHVTIDRAVRFLGLGTDALVTVAADGQGRMQAAELKERLAEVAGPVIVCAQVGNVNTGAIDPIGAICEIAHDAGAWVHVDGAFGLWAAASPRSAPLVAGIEHADSWAVDAHKWLNVPYDAGLAFCAHPEAHHGAMGVQASYLLHAAGGERDGFEHTPEFSRRARGVPIYAALRALGREGVAELVDRGCAMAARFAGELGRQDTVEVLNEVVLNQVLVRFRSPDGDHDAHTADVIARIQADGTCWMGGTTWQGQKAMRISVSNWTTDEADVDRSVQAILRCVQAATSARASRASRPAAPVQ